jgi:uncharacterized protein (DUF169 family)
LQVGVQRVNESCVTSWEDAAKSLENFLRLRTFPIGLKLCKDTQSFSKIRNLRRPTRKVLLCQLITVARTNGWTLGISKEMLLDGSPCAAMIGFGERKKVVEEGEYRTAIWFKTLSDGRKYETVFPHLPVGENNALLMGPLAGDKFQPDIVVLYGTPAQMIFVVNAFQWENYERLTFFCSGESSCADYIAGCFLSHSPQLTIPCFGERVYGHAQEEELVMAIPADQIAKILDGLTGLSKKGVRYPIPYAGPQLDVATKLPPMYLEIYGITDQPLFESWNP